MEGDREEEDRSLRKLLVFNISMRRIGPPTPQNEFNLSQWQLYALHEQFFCPLYVLHEQFLGRCMYCMSNSLAASA